MADAARGPVRVVVFGAEGCSLCAPAKAVVREVVAGFPAGAVAVEEVGIDGDAELEARYRAELPVVEIDGRKAAKYHVEPDLLAARIRRALEA